MLAITGYRWIRVGAGRESQSARPDYFGVDDIKPTAAMLDGFKSSRMGHHLLICRFSQNDLRIARGVCVTTLPEIHTSLNFHGAELG